MKSKTKMILAMVAIILGFFMPQVDMTIVNITVPFIGKYLGISADAASWILNSYNLALAVCLISASRLGDQFGRKKLFVIGLIIFGLMSFLCGISNSFVMLVVCRAIQGIGAAIIIPVSLPMTINEVPKNKMGAVVGIWGAIAGFSAAVGPGLGGILTNIFNWRFVFFVNIPIAVISIVLSLACVSESYDNTATRKIDWLGMISLAIGTFALVLALIKAPSIGWGSVECLSLLAIFVIFIAAFVIIETKIKEPMLPLWILKIKPFSASSIALFVLGLGMMSGMYFISYLLTQVMQFSELKAGLLVSAFPITGMVSSIIMGPLSAKYGSRMFGAIGMLLLALGAFLYGGLTRDSSNIDIIWRLIVAGFGMGTTFSSVTGASMRVVPYDKVGVSSGITNMGRILGTVLGIALLLTFFNVFLKSDIQTAKQQSIVAVNANKELSQNNKDAFLNKIKNAGVDIQVGAFNKAHATSASNSSDKDKVTEISNMNSSVYNIFEDNIVKSFSKTFKTTSVLLFLGIIAGFLCEPKKELESGAK